MWQFTQYNISILTKDPPKKGESIPSVIRSSAPAFNSCSVGGIFCSCFRFSRSSCGQLGDVLTYAFTLVVPLLLRGHALCVTTLTNIGPFPNSGSGKTRTRTRTRRHRHTQTAAVVNSETDRTSPWPSDQTAWRTRCESR